MTETVIIIPSFRRITDSSNILTVMAKFRKTISNYLRVAPDGGVCVCVCVDGPATVETLYFILIKNNPQNVK